MDQYVYVDILENIMMSYAEDNMPLKWVFQQDNDPEHTNRKAKQWSHDNKVEVMEWPAQLPDLNPIGNLWARSKSCFECKSIKYQPALERGSECMELDSCWTMWRIDGPQEALMRSNYKKKGNTTKY